MPANCFLLHFTILHSLPTLELRSIKENGNYLSAGEWGVGGGIFANLATFFLPLHQFQFSTFDTPLGDDLLC